jgi:hypothetical protein
MAVCIPVIYWLMFYWLLPEDAMVESMTRIDLARPWNSHGFVKT